MRIFSPDILTFDGLFGSKSDILNPRWLLTVGDAWRRILADHGFQVTQVNAHFHGGRAAQQVDLPSAEGGFDLVAVRRCDAGGMLAGDRRARCSAQVQPGIVIALIDLQGYSSFR